MHHASLVVLVLGLAGCAHRAHPAGPAPAGASPAEVAPPPRPYEPPTDRAPAWFTVTSSASAPTLRATWDDRHPAPVVELPAGAVRAIVATYDETGARLTARTDAGTLLLLDRPGGTVAQEARWLARALGLTVEVVGTEAPPPGWDPNPPAVADRRSTAGCEPTTGPIVMGQIDRQHIDDVVHLAMPRLRACYQGALREVPHLEGYVGMRFLVAPDGSVAEAVPIGTTLNRPDVEGCLATEFGALTFAKPKGCGVVIVTYPFVFMPR